MLRFWFTKGFSRFDLWVVYPICTVLLIRVSWWSAAIALFALSMASVKGEKALKREDQKLQLLRRAMLWPMEGES
jgi:hypothetical protein